MHFNGALVEKSICATQDQQRTWEVTPRADGWNELKLTMSATANPAKLHKGGDAREARARAARVRMDAGEPLTRAHRTTLAAAAAVVAVTRLFALSRSLWDWDEVLFSLALRDFNVAAHHPHPPGFPGYVALAKVMRLFVDSDFTRSRA